jgi:hypothetical protein
MIFNQKKRELIVADVRETMNRFYNWLPHNKNSIGRYCLFWSGFLVERIQTEGVKAVIQAGTTMWKRIKPEEDRPDIHNEWGYKFQYNDQTRKYLSTGTLPELHVWVAVLAHKPEIVDLTTVYWPELCANAGYNWTGELPPDYLWAYHDKMPINSSYEVDEKACHIAAGFLYNPTGPFKRFPRPVKL